MALVAWRPRDEGRNAAMNVFRMQIRAVLRARGLEFCDDETDVAGASLATEHAHATADALRHEQLVSAGVGATTTDSEDQSVENTVEDDDSFWSSTGCVQPMGVDALTYRLADPLCVLHAVTLAVYRARYQFGEPVYPPLQVSFEVGPSATALHPAGPRHDVAAADWPQTFRLPPNAPVGGYLRVLLHGRRQRQMEDRQFYLAIRHVAAHGERLPPTAVAGLAQLLRSSRVQLPASSLLPADALQLPPPHKRRQHSAANTLAAARQVFLEQEAGGQAGQPGPLRARLAAFLGFFGPPVPEDQPPRDGDPSPAAAAAADSRAQPDYGGAAAASSDIQLQAAGSAQDGGNKQKEPPDHGSDSEESLFIWTPPEVLRERQQRQQEAEEAELEEPDPEELQESDAGAE